MCNVKIHTIVIKIQEGCASYTSLYSVGSYMSHITLSCILSAKIDFSIDSDSKYNEDQEKRSDCIFF